MAIKVMANNGPTVTYNAEEIGSIWNTFAGNSDYIIKNILNEMSVSHSTSSLKPTVGTGRAVVNGRLVSVTANTQITLPANLSNNYLVVRVDLSQPVGSEGFITYTSTLKTDNLNNGGTQRDLIIAQFSTSASGVSSFTDLREIKEGSGLSGSTFVVVKDENGAALATPITFELVKKL